jgi:AraC-like DNA-binding protein
LRFPTADATSNALFRRQCDALLEQQANESSENISIRIRRYLEIFTHNFPNAADVSRAFGIPERSLRRQLSLENLSFRQLLDEVRFEKAKSYLLKSRLSVEDIALQLGYAEAAAFNHAFKRWSGITPSAFRQNRN